MNVQICFAGNSDVELVKNQLTKIKGKNPNYVFHHCFLPRKVVVEKGFSTSIVDMLDEVLGNDQICHLDKYNTFDECMKHIKEERVILSKSVDKIIILGVDVASGVREELEMFSDNRCIIAEL